uniref:Uncharacterized protein n=1 Tax=Anguilla anguilla TaxID=7936 RepID=A0A0E9T179_ANGAN
MTKQQQRKLLGLVTNKPYQACAKLFIRTVTKHLCDLCFPIHCMFAALASLIKYLSLSLSCKVSNLRLHR